MTATAPVIAFDAGDALLRRDAGPALRQLPPHDAAVGACAAEVDFPAWNIARDAGRSRGDGMTAHANPGPGARRR